MGGGTVMRAAAAKVSGFGGAVFQGGFRGATAAAPSEQAVKKSSIPVSAMLSSSSSSRAGADVAAVQCPAWEADGWEFAGGAEDGLVVAAGEPMPRVVFGGVPSFDEAKEATDELKDALDKVYLSSPESSELASNINLSGLSLASNPDSENKSTVVVESNGTLSVANHAIQAFELLSKSAEARNVVASIASDRNVYEAVIHNPVFQDFIKSNQTSIKFQEPGFPENYEGSTVEPEARDSGNWFSNAIENTIKTIKKIKLANTIKTIEKIKLTAVDLVTFLSSKFNNIFAHSPNANGDPKTGFPDATVGLGATFIGLATLVVMVVLLKRV